MLPVTARHIVINIARQYGDDSPPKAERFFAPNIDKLFLLRQ